MQNLQVNIKILFSFIILVYPIGGIWISVAQHLCYPISFIIRLAKSHILIYTKSLKVHQVIFPLSSFTSKKMDHDYCFFVIVTTVLSY